MYYNNNVQFSRILLQDKPDSHRAVNRCCTIQIPQVMVVEHVQSTEQLEKHREGCITSCTLNRLITVVNSYYCSLSQRCTFNSFSFHLSADAACTIDYNRVEWSFYATLHPGGTSEARVMEGRPSHACQLGLQRACLPHPSDIESCRRKLYLQYLTATVCLQHSVFTSPSLSIPYSI